MKRKPSPKQLEILAYLRENETITLAEATKLIGTAYAGRRRYTGMTLSRMVKQNLITRIKPGLFKLGPSISPKIPDEQMTMFSAFGLEHGNLLF